MKKTLHTTIYVTIIFGLTLLASGCRKECTEFRTYTKYTPLLKPLADVRASFSVSDAIELENPRKIYAYQNYLFIVDEFKGFQIVDNANPSSPAPLKFVNLEGCTDVSVNNGIIYANQGPDIVSLSFDQATNLTLTGRVENSIHTSLISGENYIYDFEREEVTEEVECGRTSGTRGGGRFSNGLVASAETSGGNYSGGSGSGTGGSMARMTFVEGILYVVDENTLSTINVSSGFNLLYKGNLFGGVETIFGHGDHLFLGTATGMLVYERNNGYEPTYLSGISHARGCDPVVVQDDYAFVTVRGNANCGEAEDQLMVIDISTIANPKLHSIHPMSSPYGLGVRGETLMICDGPAGLRIFDKTELSSISDNEIATIDEIDAYDIIPFENTFILSTADGVFQYDYSKPSKPKLLSKLY